MAYVRPGSTVEIVEQAATTPPGDTTQDVCIVGPGFQIEDQASAGSYDSTASSLYAMPDLVSGAIVDTTSIVVYIDNTIDDTLYTIDADGGSNWSYDSDDNELTLASGLYASIAEGTDGSSVSGESYQFSSASVDFTALTLYSGTGGDVLVIDPGGAGETEYDIAGVSGSNLLLTTDYTSGDNQDFEIRRELAGSVYVDYRALRTDIVKNMLYFSDIDDVISEAGSRAAATDPDNRLFYGAYLTASQGAPCYACGVNDLDGYLDDDDADVSAWTDVFTYLKQKPYIYSYVIESQNISVIGAAQTFADWMSAPDNRAYKCVVWAGLNRETEEVAIDTATASDGLSGNVWTDNDKNFDTYGVVPGAYLEIIDDDGTKNSFRIQTVTAHTLTLYSTPSAALSAYLTYRVVLDYFNESEEANYYKSLAESFADKRVRLAFSGGEVGISHGGTTERHPSYYLYCVRAGQVAAQENPAQPYTRDSMTEFERVYLPYTDNDLLDTIASGGVEVFVQDKTNLPVYSRHQLTTDMTNNLRSEQSVVHTNDFIANDLVIMIDYHTGKYVMNARLLDLLKAGVTARGRYYKNKIKCISLFRIVRLEESSTNDSRVDLRVRVRPYRPYNGSDIIIYAI